MLQARQLHAANGEAADDRPARRPTASDEEPLGRSGESGQPRGVSTRGGGAEARDRRVHEATLEEPLVELEGEVRDGDEESAAVEGRPEDWNRW